STFSSFRSRTRAVRSTFSFENERIVRTAIHPSSQYSLSRKALIGSQVGPASRWRQTTIHVATAPPRTALPLQPEDWKAQRETPYPKRSDTIVQFHHDSWANIRNFAIGPRIRMSVQKRSESFETLRRPASGLDSACAYLKIQAAPR